MNAVITLRSITAGPLNLSCGARKFGKISFACGQHEIEYTE